MCCTTSLVQWTPVVDGVDFPGQPLDLIRAGRIHNMPILIGFNRDEAGFLVGVIGTILGKLVDNPAIPLLNARTYRMLIGKLFHEAAPEVCTRGCVCECAFIVTPLLFQILLAYPPRPYDTRYNLDQVIQIAGDYLVTCPTFDTLDAIGAHRQNDAPRQQHPIYVYSFNFAANFLPIWLLPRCRKRNICHAMELPFVFHTVRGFLVGMHERVASRCGRVLTADPLTNSTNRNVSPSSRRKSTPSPMPSSTIGRPLLQVIMTPSTRKVEVRPHSNLIPSPWTSMIMTMM